MEYMTRHLIAIRELRHEGQHLQPGDKFEASEVDANYYLQTGVAHVPQAAPAVESESVESAPKRRGRPPNAARIAAVETVQAAEEPAAPAAEEPAVEQEAPAAESSSTEDAA